MYRYVQRDGSAMHSFYEGVCDDEIPLMQRQYELFHGQPLTETEEQAYGLWEWGKVLAIVRYIARYSPNYSICKKYISQLIDSTDRFCLFVSTSRIAGKKSFFYRLLLQLRFYGLLRWLVRRN